MKRLLALLVTVILSACGQSGPLYIPGEPSRIENPPPPAEESTDDETAKEDSDTHKG